MTSFHHPLYHFLSGRDAADSGCESNNWQNSDSHHRKKKISTFKKKICRRDYKITSFVFSSPNLEYYLNTPATSCPTLGFSCSRGGHKSKFQLLLRKIIGLQLRCPGYPDNWYSQLCLTLKERKVISGKRGVFEPLTPGMDIKINGTIPNTAITVLIYNI